MCDSGSFGSDRTGDNTEIILGRTSTISERWRWRKYGFEILRGPRPPFDAGSWGELLFNGRSSERLAVAILVLLSHLTRQRRLGLRRLGGRIVHYGKRGANLYQSIEKVADLYDASVCDMIQDEVRSASGLFRRAEKDEAYAPLAAARGCQPRQSVL